LGLFQWKKKEKRRIQKKVLETIGGNRARSVPLSKKKGGGGKRTGRGWSQREVPFRRVSLALPEKGGKGEQKNSNIRGKN